jgi:hypothetical protein
MVGVPVEVGMDTMEAEAGIGEGEGMPVGLMIPLVRDTVDKKEEMWGMTINPKILGTLLIPQTVQLLRAQDLVKSQDRSA